MRPGWFVSVWSLVLALLLHAAALALLLVSFSFTPELAPVRPVSIVNAVAVDKAKVDEEIRRFKQEDEKKQKRAEELEKKLAADEKKAEEIKNQRIEEEKQYLATRQKKEEEQKKHEEMQKQVAELEQQRKLEEEKKTQADTDKKKKAADLKKKEEEKKREEAQKAMQEQLKEEEIKAQADADKKLASALGSEIHDKIARNFNLTGLPENLSCKLRVNMLPSGEVVGVSIMQSSGNGIFDQRALTAVQKASPLPVPKDAETFERLNLRDSIFIFKP